MGRRCSKGKSCGSTCISRKKICQIELGHDPSSGLGRVAKEAVSSKGSKKERKESRGIAFSGDNLVVKGEVFTPGKTLPGSTSPTLYVDKDGKGKWVVKEGGAKGQNAVEKASNDVYKILGKPLGTGAVDSNLVDGKLVNRFIENGKTVNSLSSAERKKFDVDGHMRRSHIADALVGNWDYMGALRGDNVMVDSNGKVARIDAGGTFNYRAQGANKAYGAVPMEMWTLRSGQGKGIWADAKDADYRHLWTTQVKALRDNARSLKQSVDSSGMDPGVRRAFSQRIASLIMAGNLVATTRIGNQTIQQLADGGKISWSQVDGALRKAFDSVSGVDPAGRGWGKSVRSAILSNLEGLG
jgi:hypothetical protein